MLGSHFQLETDRLFIRPFKDGDRDVYAQIVMNGRCHTPDQIRQTAERQFPNRMDDVRARGVFWLAAFSTQAPEDLLLDIAFTPDDVQAHAYELMYFTMKRYQGQGFMTEALSAVLPALASNIPMFNVSAVAREGNRASVRVMQKAGLRRVATQTTRQDILRYVYP